MGNTVGRLSKVRHIDLAYIAGFLDGDGSIMLQLHRRAAGKPAFRVKTTICFYQDARHHKKLQWFKDILGCGYLYTRSDHISELRIEGFNKVLETLTVLQPYLRFKIDQANLLIDLIPRLLSGEITTTNINDWIRKMHELNYYSSQRNTLVDVPVTT